MNPACCYILLRVEYSGSKYGGWQRQGKLGESIVRLRSVQSTLEHSLSHICNNQEVVCVQVSGRTDKGTHALDQKCAFRIPNDTVLNDDDFLTKLNKALPKDIHVLNWVEVPATMRQIFVKKRYLYVIHQPGTINTTSNNIPYFRQFSWYVPKTLNQQALQTAIAYFVGEHDFKPVSNESGRTTTTRTILNARVYEVTSELHLPRFQNITFPTNETMNHDKNTLSTDTFLVVEFEANGFLQHQVRRMVAILRKIGEGVWPPEMVKSILDGMDYKPPPSAPSRGLYLDKVWRQEDL